MATCNFCTMDNFDLYVIGDEDIIKQWFEEDENVVSYEELSFAWDCWWIDNEKYGISEDIDTLNDELRWYHVELKSGYYEGVQIYVDTEWCNIGTWSEEDCQDEFELTKKETMCMILEEQKKINAWLAEVATMYGFRKLDCLGVFSNGEAIYAYAK